MVCPRIFVLSGESRLGEDRAVCSCLLPSYTVRSTVVWWGVASCTQDRDVAAAFMGLQGARTLFVVRGSSAVSVQTCSAVPDEAEWIFLPGTQFTVASVTKARDGLVTIELDEVVGKRLVA